MNPASYNLLTQDICILSLSVTSKRFQLNFPLFKWEYCGLLTFLDSPVGWEHSINHIYFDDTLTLMQRLSFLKNLMVRVCRVWHIKLAFKNN